MSEEGLAKLRESVADANRRLVQAEQELAALHDKNSRAANLLRSEITGKRVIISGFRLKISQLEGRPSEMHLPGHNFPKRRV